MRPQGFVDELWNRVYTEQVARDYSGIGLAHTVSAEIEMTDDLGRQRVSEALSALRECRYRSDRSARVFADECVRAYLEGCKP